MKLFRSRRRDDSGQPTRSSLDQVKVLSRAGRYAEAEAEARAVAAARSGNDDPQALVALNLAALAVSRQGRGAEAVTEWDALLPDFGRIFGAEHPRTLQLRSNRAQELATLGRHAESEAECAALIRIATRNQGANMSVLAAVARSGLVYALNGQGRHEEAEALAREALAAQPAYDRLPVVLRSNLARSLNGQGRHEEALAEAEHADQVRRSVPEERVRTVTGAVEITMATALLGLGRVAQARPLAEAAHDACLAVFGPDHYRTTEARGLLDRIDSA